jgi:Inhibitor of apoptosis-promoting Bax1
MLTGPLDVRIRDRIVSETRGNPLALLELPRGATPTELGGGFGLPGAVSLSGRIEEGFQRRMDALPGDTRSRVAWRMRTTLRGTDTAPQLPRAPQGEPHEYRGPRLIRRRDPSRPRAAARIGARPGSSAYAKVAIFASIPRANLIYAVAGLAIFGGFTMFDFNRVLRTGTEGAVPIAASIFLDIFNVFLLLLQLFGGERQ